MPVDAVRLHILRCRLHDRRFADFELGAFRALPLSGARTARARPSLQRAWRGMSKQALNYQLGQLERLGYCERRRGTPTTSAASASS